MERAKVGQIRRHLGEIREERMLKQTIIGYNLECEYGKHTQHLCYMVFHGSHLSDGHQYEVLIQEPEFKCRLYGRVVKKATNLCHPLKMRKCDNKV